ncbi:MAG TPA: CopD family protein [Chitinophagaceae bacterium]|nr:CopD family protein [Chitinophagaceae bacterium]
MVSYLRALHIIFIVTWFSGLFYMVRLFVYHTEAHDRPEPDKSILGRQYRIMIRRLWLGITWPSAILTLIFGPWTLYAEGYLSTGIPVWLWVKLGFVLGLYLYHFSLQVIYRQQMRGIFRFSSAALRMWNELATIFLVAIVFLVTVQDTLNALWGVAVLILLVLLLIIAIRVYQYVRTRKGP